MRLKEIVESYGVLSLIGYVRRSRQDIEREKRTGEDTLTEQKELINRILMDIELPYTIETEIGSGENIEGRPVFKQVLKDLQSKKYDAIAVKELSRLSRGSYSDAGRIIEIITENRLIIVTPYKVYDPRNPMDMKQIRFELFLAREEYEMIRERMTGAKYIYASQGKWMSGAAPFGYKFNKKTQKLDIDEEQSKVVRLIYDLFLYGLNGENVSYQAIATHLTRLGIETPRKKKTWSYPQVKLILSNPLYKGDIFYRTTERKKNGKKVERPESEHIYVEDAHEPIIEKSEWEKVQHKINDKLPQPHNPLDFEPNELASVCTCAECGSKLIRNAGKRKYAKKNGDDSTYYQEFLKCLRGGCMSVKYRDVENAILTALSQLKVLDSSELKNQIEKIIDDKFNNNHDLILNNQLKDQITQKEKELKNRLAFIYDKYEKGIYTDEMFLERKEVIDRDQKELLNLKNQSESSVATKDKIDVDKIKINIESILHAYNSAKTKEEKNKILREVFEDVSVEIIQKGRGRTPAKFIIYPTIRYSWIEKAFI